VEPATTERIQRMIDAEAAGRFPAGAVPQLALLHYGGPADLATLDALITAGIAASRSEGARWALARLRQQPADAQLSARAREPGGSQTRTGLNQAERDQLQSRLEEQVNEHFPDGGVQRSFPVAATSSSGSARTAARAEASTGSVPRQMIRPAAGRI
jgi:hypothetical protein